MSEQIVFSPTRKERLIAACMAPVYRFIATFGGLLSGTSSEKTDEKPAKTPAVTTDEPGLESETLFSPKLEPEHLIGFVPMEREPYSRTRPVASRLTVLGTGGQHQLNRSFNCEEDIPFSGQSEPDPTPPQSAA